MQEWTAVSNKKTRSDLTGMIADTLNLLMAIPNLISLLLSPVIVSLMRDYFADRPASSGRTKS